MAAHGTPECPATAVAGRCFQQQLPNDTDQVARQMFLHVAVCLHCLGVSQNRRKSHDGVFFYQMFWRAALCSTSTR